MKLYKSKWLVCAFLLMTFQPLAQSLVIEPSRTTGTAPLYVFFDATNSTGLDGVNDLPNADFSWDFDVNDNDPNGSWELTKGMVTGHVFEAPGTYTVSCTMIARNGTVDSKEVTITVSEFSGTTYYVSNDGSDGNDGLSGDTPWATANHAFSQLEDDQRILFKRGNVFEGTSQGIRNLNGEVKIISAYGEGELPILRSSSGSEVFDINNCTNFIIQDLHLENINFTDGTSNSNSRGLRVQESTQVLALRLEIESALAFAAYQDDGDLLGVFDCNIHNIGAMGIFCSDSRRFSWVGNTIDSMITQQPEHGIRIQGGEKHFVGHSEFTHLFDTKTSVTVRGDGQRHAMIYKNKMDRIIQISPTNEFEPQFVSLATVEGNYVGQNPVYENTNFSPSISAVNIIASEVVVRNNVFDGLRRGITVTVEHPEVVPSNIDIYNNTMHWRAVNETSGANGRLVRVDDSQNITIRNNLMSASNENGMQIISGGGNTNLVESNNLMTTDPVYLSELEDSPAHINSIANYKLAENSPAVDQGSLDVPVYFDQTARKRYYGSAPDLGAFEYDDGGGLTNPDLSEGRQPLGNIEVRPFLIYPNPVANVVHLDPQHLGKELIIVSLNGSKVLHLHNLNETRLDISNLPEGLYFIKMIGDHEIGKFIKK